MRTVEGDAWEELASAGVAWGGLGSHEKEPDRWEGQGPREKLSGIRGQWVGAGQLLGSHQGELMSQKVRSLAQGP